MNGMLIVHETKRSHLLERWIFPTCCFTGQFHWFLNKVLANINNRYRLLQLIEVGFSMHPPPISINFLFFWLKTVGFTLLVKFLQWLPLYLKVSTKLWHNNHFFLYFTHRWMTQARCTRLRPVRFFGARMGLILWCRVFFGCAWYGLRSSRTCFYIDASDSLLRVQKRAVLVDNTQTHHTRRMPCAYSFRAEQDIDLRKVVLKLLHEFSFQFDFELWFPQNLELIEFSRNICTSEFAKGKNRKGTGASCRPKG